MKKSYKKEFDWFIKEIRDSQQPKETLVLKSIFFGGGSPSIAPTELIKDLISYFKESMDVAEDIEVTLEANPTSVETEKMIHWEKGGVNRLSMGVQALNEKDLKYLGRKHSVKEAIDAISLAKQLFPRFSFDLIYARHQNHSISEWEEELQYAMTLAGGHLSLYSLTIEPNTPFHKKFEKKQLFLPIDDTAAEMYERTVQICADYGMNQYEVSNFAKEGHQSYHNINYWNSGEWIGLGPGAASRLNLGETRTSFLQRKSPARWMKAVEGTGHGTAERNSLSHDERMEEVIMMGLRTAEGIDNQHVFQWLTDGGKRTLEKFKDMKLLHYSGTHIQATSNGLAVLNSIVSEIIHSNDPNK